MANLFNYYPKKTYFKVNMDEYWDFYLNLDNSLSYKMFSNGEMLYDKCLISNIDIDNICSYDNDWFYSTNESVWENANVIDNTLYNIGYTGLDNGLIPFRRDKVNNREFVEVYTNSKYTFEEGDTVLKLHKVSGGTTLYDYPLTVLDDKIKLNGGFYQGFFKTQCDKYMVLPDKLEEDDEWNFQFTLNKVEFEKESNKTLNDKHPNNKGIFFYIGTRAENKWIYLYDDIDDECFTLSYDNYIEDAYIDKKNHKIDSFIDMGVEMPVEWESIAIDDYLNFKYYDEDLYNNTCNISDDIINNFVQIDGIKPPIIDEENESFTSIAWCCQYKIQQESTKYVRTCCGTCCHSIPDGIEIKETTIGGYFSKCEIFGDDYLSDIDMLEDATQYIEDDLDISDFTYETYDGIYLHLNGHYYIETDNKFLLFDRTCDGFTIKNWEEGTVVRYYGQKNEFKGNLFLLMNRTCTGYNVNTIDEYRDSFKKEYNIYSDIYNNALAFRITDDGRIGYRYMTIDCESENKVGIKEGYSKQDIIKENEWYSINVKIKASQTKMKLYFYVNGMLKFVSDELDKLDLRELNDIYEKQETVPFNISLGGGTQGLAETILPNYMLDPYRVYPIEENFAGSFIGYMRSFRFYNCKLEHLNILNNSKYDLSKIKNIYKK